jgi:hypothetical protein
MTPPSTEDQTPRVTESAGSLVIERGEAAMRFDAVLRVPPHYVSALLIWRGRDWIRLLDPAAPSLHI